MLRSARFANHATGKIGNPFSQFQSFRWPREMRVVYLKDAKFSPCPLPYSNFRLFNSDTPPHPSSSPPPADQRSPEFQAWAISKLPLICPGCGAPSQTVDRTAPGYYNVRTHAIRKFLGVVRPSPKIKEREIIRSALENAAHLNLDLDFGDVSARKGNLIIQFGTLANPLLDVPAHSVKCFRCRNILNHRIPTPMVHASIEAIRDTLEETPYKYNHVYHVIDAADFPMSLVPELQRILKASPLRSKNRRSKTSKFFHGKNTEISFIITRSDLLAPLKEQVDAMMPYLQMTLRDALGQLAANMRLGNVHCVSAKRGWWTKELKEELWNRGGAGWMVGKVNVGKSQLFNVIFPKRRSEIDITMPSGHAQTEDTIEKEPHAVPDGNNQLESVNSVDIDAKNNLQDCDKSEILIEETSGEQNTLDSKIEELENDDSKEKFLDSELLLPPLQPEHQYPEMPVVSAQPGTTASPIRLSFGKSKGELIDLPGLSRGDLLEYVLPKYRDKLIMCSRVLPEQLTIKPAQSLLLGGMIRITPTSPDTVILAYCFTTIEPHVTNTLKAIGTQMQTRESNVMNISVPGTGEKITSAGKFLLKWDVTKKRTGPVTAHDAGRVRVDQLPYRVLTTDILIEGCGWVELVAQVSKERGASKIRPLDPQTDPDTPDKELSDPNEEIDQKWPEVEIFTPHGKYVAARRPMNAWSIVCKKSAKSARPRAAVAGRRSESEERMSEPKYLNYC